MAINVIKNHCPQNHPCPSVRVCPVGRYRKPVLMRRLLTYQNASIVACVPASARAGLWNPADKGAGIVDKKWHRSLLSTIAVMVVALLIAVAITSRGPALHSDEE